MNLPKMGALVEPPLDYEGPNRVMNWRGSLIEVGDGFSPFFLREVESRKRNIEACIIGLFGGAGKGKTYMGLRQAELIDPKFNPEIQIAFGPESFLYLIGPDSPLRMGQVIIVDEAQFSAGSRNWYNQIQKDLMAHLEAVRSKGLIIFIVALNIKTLDVIARSYVLTHMIYMKKRGHGIAYRFYTTPFGAEPYKSRLGTIESKLPGCGDCEYKSCLRCPESGIAQKNNPEPYCDNIRVRYERRKKSYLAEQARASETTRKEKKAPKKQTSKQIAELFGQNAWGSLPLQKIGHKRDIDFLRNEIAKLTGKEDVSLFQARQVRHEGELLYESKTNMGQSQK